MHVGKLKEQEPFDQTEFAKEVTAILANLAQTVAVVALAVRTKQWTNNLKRFKYIISI